MKGLSEVLFENSFPQKDAKNLSWVLNLLHVGQTSRMMYVVRNIVHAFTEI
jgi:hypothetical protein